jgi:hypothetical protein
MMDLELLRKKISSYKTSKGRLTRVPDELAIEILHSWERWSGPASGFYSALEVDFRKMASVLGRAKKLKREGHIISESDFKELTIDTDSGQVVESRPCQGIEVLWGTNKIVRFSQIDQLLEFLKKAA